MKRLNEVFSNWNSPDADGGIFWYLDDFASSVPWADDDIAAELDMKYHGTYSGEKVVGPLVTAYMEDDETVTDANKSLIARSIVYTYASKWQKAWATLNLDYNPIENYNMTETESPAETTQSSTSNSGVYGYNSSTSVPADTASGSIVNTTQTARSLTRSGNIGVTTSQQMIEQERKIALYDYFREVVFPDLDKALTVPIY